MNDVSKSFENERELGDCTLVFLYLEVDSKTFLLAILLNRSCGLADHFAVIITVNNKMGVDVVTVGDAELRVLFFSGKLDIRNDCSLVREWSPIFYNIVIYNRNTNDIISRRCSSSGI